MPVATSWGDRHHPDAEIAEVARHRQAHPGDRGFGGGVGDEAGLPAERRQRRRVDDDAALVVLGLVATHLGSGEPVHVERGDDVEIEDRTKRVEVVRAGFAERALGGAAASGGGHRHVQTAEPLHGPASARSVPAKSVTSAG